MFNFSWLFIYLVGSYKLLKTKFLQKLSGSNRDTTRNIDAERGLHEKIWWTKTDLVAVFKQSSSVDILCTYEIIIGQIKHLSLPLWINLLGEPVLTPEA